MNKILIQKRLQFIFSSIVSVENSYILISSIISNTYMSFQKIQIFSISSEVCDENQIHKEKQSTFLAG